MKIGIIVKNDDKLSYNLSHHSAYYIMGLAKCDEITEIVSNSKLIPAYSWFKIPEDKIIIKSINDIESDNTLDFVLYDWYFFKCKECPNAKSKKIVFDMTDMIYPFSWENQKRLNMFDYVFKISLVKDRECLYMPSKRVEHHEHEVITKEISLKYRPLMYVGSSAVPYPDLPFISRYSISFHGSITSKDRIESVKTLKETFGDKFFGGFMRDTRKNSIFDEDGFQLIGEKTIYNVPRVDYNMYLKLMRLSVISLSPAGFGRNTHRFIDILGMGGFALAADNTHIDYGMLGPKDGIHYVCYNRNRSDLVDKVNYYLKNRDKALEIGERAKKYMSKTYCNSSLMAKTYILNVIN